MENLKQFQENINMNAVQDEDTRSWIANLIQFVKKLQELWKSQVAYATDPPEKDKPKGKPKPGPGEPSPEDFTRGIKLDSITDKEFQKSVKGLMEYSQELYTKVYGTE